MQRRNGFRTTIRISSAIVLLAASPIAFAVGGAEAPRESASIEVSSLQRRHAAAVPEPGSMALMAAALLALSAATHRHRRGRRLPGHDSVTAETGALAAD